MTITSLANLVLTVTLVMLGVVVVLSALAIQNHRRLTRRAKEEYSAIDTQAASAELLEALKRASPNRGTPVEISRFWKGDSRNIKQNAQYLILERLMDAGVIKPAEYHQGWLSTLAAFIDYAFCRAPHVVSLTDQAWERMVFSQASPTVIVEGLEVAVTDHIVTDHISAAHSGVIVNRSALTNSTNSVTEDDPVLADALKEIADFVQQSGNADAADYFSGFVEELQNSRPRKLRLSLFWNGVVDALPEITRLSEPVAKIGELLT